MQVQDRKQHMFSGRSDNWMPSAPLWPSACEHPEGDAVVHPKWALGELSRSGLGMVIRRAGRRTGLFTNPEPAAVKRDAEEDWNR
jgi:hypothetical protein